MKKKPKRISIKKILKAHNFTMKNIKLGELRVKKVQSN